LTQASRSSAQHQHHADTRHQHEQQAAGSGRDGRAEAGLAGSRPKVSSLLLGAHLDGTQHGHHVRLSEAKLEGFTIEHVADVEKRRDDPCLARRVGDQPIVLQNTGAST
jgi:hypothetical protein